MARDTVTSTRVAKTASKILENCRGLGTPPRDYAMKAALEGVSFAELKALASSALNQAPDKPKRTKTKRAKKR